MRYLVTGGAGFIGSHTAEALVAQGEEVVVVDNLETGDLSNLENIKDRIQFENESILDLDFMRHILKDIDFVIHLAGYASVNASMLDPLFTHRINIQGSLNVLKIATESQRIKRLVFASSAAIHGNSPDSKQALSPYALEKQTIEAYAELFHRIYGLSSVGLRYFNVYGSRQRINGGYSSVISRFMQAALEDKPISIFGDGLQTRDFVHVRDIARANIMACLSTSPEIGGKSFDIGTDKATSVLDAARAIRELIKSNVPLVFNPIRQGDISHSCADLRQASSFLGYQPMTSLEEGLTELLEWTRYFEAPTPPPE